jgi:hypothetical protein
MKYTFHRIQCHPKIPHLTGWYLELRPDNVDTLMAVHKGVTGAYFRRFGLDPHIKTDEVLQHYYHPIKLAAGWLESVERFLFCGESVLINENGGFIPMNRAIILDTVESDSLSWFERHDDETITVSRWSRGRHWYISSNKHRVFVPTKYNTLDEARHEALRYVPEERLQIKEST